jgi:RNA polymerase sigma factor (TIGR02999 family)
MRRILLNWARDQGRAKRGGQALRVSLSGVADVAVRRREDLIALDDALEDLEAIDPRKSRVVELRYFAGLSLEETADVLHVSVATVRRDWSLARAWLQRALGAPGGRRSAAAGAQR